jgi:hypothetical protein
MSCALDMMLLLVSAIKYLKFMALSLGLGVLGTPKMSLCPLNVRISLIVASIFYISAVYGPIGLFFGYDAFQKEVISNVKINVSGS